MKKMYALLASCVALAIAAELPEKCDETKYNSLTDEQKTWYEEETTPVASANENGTEPKENANANAGEVAEGQPQGEAETAAAE